jgi:hypothetical protein
VEQRRSVSRPVREILAYFLRNPGVADSLEGIARWRLLEEVIHRNVVETQSALEWLVKEGLLVAIDRPATGRLFQLNPERRNQAELVLEKSGGKRAPRSSKT